MDTSPTIHFPDVYRRTISHEFKIDENEEFADTNSETTEINEMSETSQVHKKKTLLQQIYSFFKYYVCYKKKNLLLKKRNKKGFFFYDK